jgi:RNA polymerase sigma-70 factor (ECF subfamily)
MLGTELVSAFPTPHQERGAMSTQTDEEKISALYQAYQRPIYNLAYRMTGHKETAEDIVQETFTRVAKNYAQFKNQSQVFTWIYTIAKNICRRQYAQNKRRSFQTLEKLIEQEMGTSRVDPLAEMQKRYYAGQVKEGCLSGLLRCLSFHQRIAFILNVLFEIPIPCVAKIINKSENTAHILTHRARKNIRAFLCKNCSLYDPQNKCQCQNLISFSLKQGWITQAPVDLPLKIETEVKAFKDEIALYRSLPDQPTSPELEQKIAIFMRSSNFLIFSPKKVKVKPFPRI